MNFKFIKSTNLTALIAAVMTLGANHVFAEEPSSDVDALEREVDYIEALVDNGYSDFASDVIAKAKEKWPSAKNDPRIFALEVRGLLGIEKYEEAEKKIDELPKTNTDEYWQTFWAAKLELANNYFARGRKAECIKIYEDFFAKYPTPPEGIRRFHMQASYSFGQLVVADKKIQQAAERYESFLSLLAKRKNLTEDEENTWCNVATETAEMYLRLAAEKPKIEDRKVFLKKANKIISELLWKQDMYVYFGRAIALRAHMQLLSGNIAKAQETIDEYMPQLQSIHDNLVAAESQGYPGVLRLSPMPQCRFLLAQMLWDEAKVLYEKTPRDDEKIKSLLFGEKKGAKRTGAGAYNHSLNVFIRYPESPWAAKAATLTDEIERFVIEKYKAKINKQITPEQLAKVREGQFRDAGVLFADGKYEEAIEAYWTVLAEYPEYSESIQAIENIIDSYQSLMIRAKEGEEAKVAEWRIDCDAIEGYLSERFAHAEKVLMTTAGDAVQRVAAGEKQRGQIARYDALMKAFFSNYTDHPNAGQIAISMASEAVNAKKWADALAIYKVVDKFYTSSPYYASSVMQMSKCYHELGDEEKSIEALKKYLTVEKNPLYRDSAQMQLAQKYMESGFDMLKITPEEAKEQGKDPAILQAEGSKLIINGIKQFSLFADGAKIAIEKPGTLPKDKEQYKNLRDAALFLVGNCWGRLATAASKSSIEKFKAAADGIRDKAVKSYEQYIVDYPNGKYAPRAYVQLGTIYTILKNPEKSKEALDALAKKYPDSYEAKNSKPRLAKSLIEMGFVDAGTDLYAEMLKLDAAYTPRQFLDAGEALAEANSWKLAEEAFNKVVQKVGLATNMNYYLARARLGSANALFHQKSYAEAREALDQFVNDENMARSPLQSDAQFLMAEIASEQGKTERDATQRAAYFSSARAALNKVKSYWSRRPKWEQDKLTLMSADIQIRHMKAEEMMGLKEEADETRRLAASSLQSFIQSNAPNEQHPADKMAAEELANLEKCYVTMIPLFLAIGPDQASRVMRYGEEYLNLFPNGMQRQEIINCMNAAKADIGPSTPAQGTAPAAEEKKADAPAADAPAAEAAPVSEEPAEESSLAE